MRVSSFVLTAVLLFSSCSPDDSLSVPVFAIHGTMDEVFPFEAVKTKVDGLIAEGAPHVFFPMEGLAHSAMVGYVPGVSAAFSWLDPILK